MPIKIPTVQTGLEASIQSAAKKAGRNLKINMGGNAKSIEGLSQPLGRITGKADQFTKSMEAANARVLAFGASVGILAAVTRGFKELVLTTIEVEKSLISINSILGTNAKELEAFSKTIFNVARNTEQSFNTVATAALELSRQGLDATEVQKRLADSMILTRVSGLGATEAVSGLTAAINSFNKSGLSSSVILNKLSAAAVAAAVSERDLIEGIKRAGSVANLAGVSFDELVGVITAVQVKTARGGSVIGNSFKTIFTRIQSIEKLETMQRLGVDVEAAGGEVLGATKLIQNLAKVLAEMPEAKQLQIAEDLVGKFQVAPFLALLDDYNSKTSIAIDLTKVSQNATREAYERNVALNEALSAAINVATLNLKELADTLGRIGVTDNLQNLLGFFNTLVEDVKGILDGEGAGGDFARGIVKGIGAVISGPGLAIFGAIIIKLGVDLARFGLGSLKTFFGLNRAAKEQATLQGQIASTLLGNKGIQESILAIENSSLSAEKKKVAQTKFFTTAIREQLGVMQEMQGIASTIAPGVRDGTRPVRRRGGKGRAAGGFIPNYNAIAGYGSESSDISKGVGGAPTSAKPVTIPNFNFGGGQKGTMVANSSEYVVPNYAGSGGSAIFNQDMVSSMGMPAGARKIGAAGGYIPNFADLSKNKITLFNKFLANKGLKAKDLAGEGPRWSVTQRAYDNTKFGFGKQFDNLSPSALRALKVESRQESVVEKGTEQRSSYGILYPDAKGGAPATTITHKKKRIRIIPVATEPSDVLYKQVRESLVSAASKYATELGFDPDIIKEEKFKKAVDRNLNEGSVESAFGTVFEAAFQGAIGTNQKSNARWDLGSRTSIEKLLSSISSKGVLTKTVKPELQNIQKADFKNSLSDDNLNSIVGKIEASPYKKDSPTKKTSRTSNSAGGYIPNFANPLQDAIGREQAAGLPVNQIRVNQSPKLRNAGNPMGLAVTNTRDEPTGAIPNFAQYRNSSGQFAKRPQLPTGGTLNIGSGKPPQLPNSTIKQIDDLGESAGKAAAGQRDMLGGIFATQIAFSALAGATSDMDEGFGRFANRITTLGSSITTAAFAGSAINDFGKSIEGAGGQFVSKLGILGSAIGGGIAVFNSANKILQDMSGETDRSSRAMAELADITKTLSVDFKSLSATQQIDAKITAKDALNRAVDFSSPTVGGQFFQKTEGVFEDFIASFGLGQGGSGEGEKRRDFSTDEVEASVLQAAQSFAAFGESADTINERLEKFGSTVDSKNASQFFKELKALDIASKNFRKTLEAAPDTDLNVDSMPDSFFPMLTREFKANVRNDIIKERKGVLITNDKKSDRVKASIAKQEIQFTVDLAKADRTVLDQMDKKVLKAELSKSLTEDEMIALKTEQSILQANFSLRNKTLDVVANMSKASKELSFKEKASAELQTLIAESAKKTNFTTAERKQLILKINKLLEESDESIQDILRKEVDSLSVEENKTGEFIKQKGLMGDIKVIASKIANIRAATDLKAIGNTQSNTFNKNQTLEEAIKSRQLNSIKRGRGAKTILEQESLAKQAANDSVLNAKDEAQKARNSLEANEKKSITDKIGSIGAGNLTDLLVDNLFKGDLSIDDFLANTPSASSLVDQEGASKALDLAINSLEGRGGDKEIKRQELISFRQGLIESSTALDAQSKSAIENAEANLKAAGFFQKSSAQLSEDMALQLRRGGIQGKIDAQMIVDPTERRKALQSEDSRDKRANAIKNEDFKEFRRLVEEDQFNGKLIDASAQFAHNIGDAMTEAIIQGGNLSDILIGTATSFFTTLSKAYMTRAVDSVIGKFASGGKVTGGSGNRDDVPALLTGGEFVMKKSSVSKYGSSFMESLNAGSIPAMARGGLFTPGTYGQEEIKGKSNLIDFATQSFTTGASDRFGSGTGSASVNLEPQSAALTMFGRRNSPAFQREQDSKQNAFGLFTQQIEKEQQAREEKRQAKKGLKNSIFAAVASAGFSSLATKFGKAPLAEAVNPPNAIKVNGGRGQSSGVGIFQNGVFHNLDGLTSGEIFGTGALPPNLATGGSIPNAAGVDTVPSMLSGGEFVMNAAATQKIGRGSLNALNSGADGGSGDIVSKLDELISVSDNSGETIINITVNSDGSSDTQGGGDDQQTSLATRIKDVVKQVIDDEKRLGGSLRQARA